MTPADAILDGYESAVHRLVMLIRALPRGTQEVETPERLAQCQARKQELVSQAIEAGVLRREPGGDDR
jgi:hypothetical protein